MKAAFHYLQAHGHRATAFQWAHGIYDHYITNYDQVVSDAKRHVCDYSVYSGTGTLSIRHFLKSALENKHERISKRSVVVLGAGTWDLRDEGVDKFLHDFEAVMPLIERLQQQGYRLIVRTPPPYSYKRGDALGSREMRTNEKLRLASQGMVQLAQRAHVQVWDSFAILLPRFEESVDTHHYIDRSSNANAPGVADLSYLMHLVCKGS